MKRTLSVNLLAIFCLTGLALKPISLPAQSIWLRRSPEKTIAIEVLKPNFAGEFNTTFLTSAAFLSTRIPLNKKLVFVGELPFANGGIDYQLGRLASGGTVGNPYLGLEIRQPTSSVFAEIGVRLPLAAENNFGAVVGTRTDFDRADAFIDHTLTVNVLMNYLEKDASNLFFRLRLGAAFLNNIQGRLGTSVNLLYSGQIGYEVDPFNVIVGLSGRWNVSEGFSGFGLRASHQFGVAASVRLGVVQPGLLFRLPVDEILNEAVDYVVGLHLGIDWR
ncbi:MAG: hypothetical protein ACE5HO_01500 [bacterium]